MYYLFTTPVKEKKVRIGVFAYQYSNGIINISGVSYHFYSMTGAINKFRKDYPARPKHKVKR